MGAAQPGRPLHRAHHKPPFCATFAITLNHRCDTQWADIACRHNR
jgi:hypothetical protein